MTLFSNIRVLVVDDRPILQTRLTIIMRCYFAIGRHPYLTIGVSPDRKIGMATF
ncbi:hypothetical protein [Nostoc sp.]|uniref:hypothetical protein n=1 Tax=Nostoc sp. TaxID=1180 RepID=UPI002FF68AD1